KAEKIELSRRLGLDYEPQDWGIANGTPCRVAEFMEFYETETLEPGQKYDMIELIIASMNEALLAGPVDQEVLCRFRGFCQKHLTDAPLQRDYWLRLRDLSEFPIVAILKELS
ncbi:MAG: hypothetical protein NT049_18235, partial [Planctomycetota bacterium]|nr:hypothetical protein [Planctomycetota bacterium]